VRIELREASTPAEWDDAMAMLTAVYVDGGFTAAEMAASLFNRTKLDGQGALLVALGEGGKVAGAVFMLRSGSTLRQIASDREAEFRLLGVDPSCRGSGIGEALVRQCVSLAKASSASALVLSTQKTMTAAHRLYERLGFVRHPERDWQTPTGRTMLVYEVGL
jgi:ribosomal protein S18 acetylase RimI-like enzyme